MKFYLKDRRMYLSFVLYVMGLIYWIYFLKDGLAYAPHDWLEESTYVNTLRSSLESLIIPWMWSEASPQGIYAFMANPQVPLTPDFLLLPWISTTLYFILHVLLFYSLGLFGTLLLAKKLCFNFAALIFFWLLFNFNGYVTSHLAVGHLPWTGYFLLPLFFYFLSDIEKVKNNTLTPQISIGLILGVLFINGSFHLAIWCCMFMLISCLLRKELIAGVALSIIIGGVIGLGKLLPGLLYLSVKHHFVSGYPSISMLLDAFTVLQSQDFRVTGSMGVLGWHECSVYIGFVAFFIFVGLSIFSLMKPHKLYPQHFIIASATMFILSMGNVYSFIADSGLPLASAERVSSRFIVMPFILFLILASSSLSEIIKSASKKFNAIAMLALFFVAGELYQNFLIWKVQSVFGNDETRSSQLIPLAVSVDKTYELVVYFSWSISILTILLSVSYLYRNIIKKRKFYVSEKSPNTII